ncbi:unnamed protein product, partial [Tenebrio molitor]
EIALKTASLWYSWDNITEEYKNNEIKFRPSPHERSEYKSGKNDFAASLKGTTAPQAELKNNEIKKEDDRNESEWKILKLPNDYEIDFSHGKIHDLLGFDKKIYKEGINYATKIGNITKDIDQILIHCSLVSSSYQNNLK